jgi:transcriptional regulator with GAF, ATPase, and Fis domain
VTPERLAEIHAARADDKLWSSDTVGELLDYVDYLKGNLRSAAECIDAYVTACARGNAENERLKAELDEVTDLDRSALKTQELRDERSRAVAKWYEQKKRADQAETERDDARRIARTLTRHVGVVAATALCHAKLGIDPPDWFFGVHDEELQP